MAQDERENTNPAKRILAILEEAQAHQDTARTFDVWQSVLGGESPLGTVRRLDWLDRQFETTERLIKRIDDIDHKYFLDGFSTLRKAIAVEYFNQPWSKVKGYLGPLPLRNLGFCSLELDRHSGELKIEEETLKAIQEDVDKLLDEVLGADLPTSLGDFIVRQLQTIKNAIVEYRLGGVEALEEALERIVGALILKRREVQLNPNEPRVKRLLQIVWKTAQAVQTARSVAELPGAVEEVRKLLQ